MICDRCNQPFKPGQPVETTIVEGGSVGAANVNLHAYGCEPTPRQTAPVPTPGK